MHQHNRGKHPSLCVYCTSPADTVDHIPPKSLFPKPRPNNLITVPACKLCNHGFKQDDDLLRTLLVTTAATKDHLAVVKLREKEVRGLQRTESEGFQRWFYNGLEIVWEVKSDGTIEPHASFDLAPVWDRFDRYIRRIVHGLFWHVTGRLLQSPYDSMLVPWHRIDELGPALQNVMASMLDEPPICIGDDTFTYRFRQHDDTHETVWLLSFYGAVWFLVYTGRVGEMGAEE